MGNSDAHAPGDAVGLPHNVVRAGSLSTTALLDSLRVGRSYAVESSAVTVDFTASANGVTVGPGEELPLGFFDAANWSCALKTTQAILRPEERTLGNGILQSGAAVGAVLTPLLVLGFLYWGIYSGWRPAFWSVVRGAGVISSMWAPAAPPARRTMVPMNAGPNP